MTQQEGWAKRLVALGYSIFPIDEGTKMPGLKWSEESTCDPAMVEYWWGCFPDDNIGINCGESRLLVIDLDSEEAADEWDTLWDRREVSPWDTGDYPVVATPRGYHIYFDAGRKEFRNTASKLAPGIDSRGSGGMVLGVGSVVDGRAYHLVRGSLDRVGPAPAWLSKHLERPKESAYQAARRSTKWRPVSEYRAKQVLKRWCSKIADAPDGEQNTTINAAAFILSRDYIPPLLVEDVAHELEMAAERGNHPMSRARATIRSGLGC